MGVGDPKVSSWPKKKYETWQAFNQSLSMKTGSEEEDLRQIVDANDPLQNKRTERNIPATSAFYNIPQLEPLRPTQCLDVFSSLGSANPPPSKPADQGAQPPNSKRRRVRKQDGSKPNQGSKYASITIDDKEAALYSSDDEVEEPDTPVPEPKPAPPVSKPSVQKPQLSQLAQNPQIKAQALVPQKPQAPKAHALKPSTPTPTRLTQIQKPPMPAPATAQAQAQAQIQSVAQPPSLASKQKGSLPGLHGLKAKLSSSSVTPKTSLHSPGLNPGAESKPPLAKGSAEPMHRLQGAGSPLAHAALKEYPKNPLSPEATGKPIQMDAHVRPESAKSATASINRPQIMAQRPPQRPHVPRPALQPAYTAASPARPIIAHAVARPVVERQPTAPLTKINDSALQLPVTPLSPLRPALSPRPQSPARNTLSSASGPAALPRSQKPATQQPLKQSTLTVDSPATSAKQAPIIPKPGAAAANTPGTIGAIAQKPPALTNLSQVQKQQLSARPMAATPRPPSAVQQHPQPQPRPQPQLQQQQQQQHSWPPLTLRPIQKASSIAANTTATPNSVEMLLKKIEQINVITTAIRHLDNSGFDTKSHLNPAKFNSDAQRALVIAKQLFGTVAGNTRKI
ncbi:hypothetical protein GGF40_001663 [Coemansia sp. RSA 1286]|nr:hypothetical protein GGF40_001663 [Coemansia sp. RSA 1286]